MNLASIPQRPGLVLTILIGIMSAVGVLVSMLALGVGARREIMANVRPDRVILMSSGSPGPMQSRISKDRALLLHELPGVRRNERGEPIAVSQSLVLIKARTKSSGMLVGFPLIGVSPGLRDYSPELYLTAGRLFEPGLRELIASNACTGKFANFSVGDTRSMRGGDWLVVGNFNMGRAQGPCVAFADADTVLSVFDRNQYNQVAVLLKSAESFGELTHAIRVDPTLQIEVRREAELLEQNAKQFTGMLNFASYVLGSIMATAATLGAANGLYAIVESRRRELATLRAIGFGAAPLILSLLLESVLLALPAGLLGAALAWVLFNDLTARPFGLALHLAVTAPLSALGVAWALAIGILAGLLPAFSVVRSPVATATRAA